MSKGYDLVFVNKSFVKKHGISVFFEVKIGKNLIFDNSTLYFRSNIFKKKFIWSLRFCLIIYFF